LSEFNCSLLDRIQLETTLMHSESFVENASIRMIGVMCKAGIPELEQRLIINLYWNQYAVVRIKGETQEDYA